MLNVQMIARDDMYAATQGNVFTSLNADFRKPAVGRIIRNVSQVIYIAYVHCIFISAI